MSGASKAEKFRSTTVIAVVRDGRIAMASDGQVTVGDTIVKRSAQKADIRASLTFFTV